VSILTPRKRSDMFGATSAVEVLLDILSKMRTDLTKNSKYNNQPDLSDKNWKKTKDGKMIYIEPKKK